MLGDVYLLSALAIFFAIYGWSESIFGLSKETKRKISHFLSKTRLTQEKYNKLKDLVSKAKEMDPGRYLKELMTILKGTTLSKGGKEVFDKLKKNEEELNELSGLDSLKQKLFLSLFIFLFVMGTFISIVENSNLLQLQLNIFGISISFYIFLIILFQILLFAITLWGFVIFDKTKKHESLIQNNLNDLIMD